MRIGGVRDSKPGQPSQSRDWGFQPSKVTLALSFLLLATTAGLLAVLTLLQKYNPDIWFHLKTGDVISTTHSVPTRDIFSFTASGRRWITHEWLTEVLLFQIYRWFSISGLAVTKVLLVLTAAALVVWNAILRAGRHPFEGLVLSSLVWLMAFSSWDTFVIRPHLLSWLCLLGFLQIIYRFKEGRLESLRLLVPLQLLWANVHGFAVFGPLLLGVMWLGETLNARFSRPASTANSPERRKQLFFYTFLVLGLSFLTPNSYHMVFQPFTLMATSMYQLNEWKPPFSSFYRAYAFVPFFIAWLVVIVGSFLLNWKKRDYVDLLISGLFVALALRSQRNIPLTFIVLIPVVYRNLIEVVNGSAGAASGFIRRKAGLVGYSGLSVALAVLMAAQIVGISSGGLALSAKEMPKRVSLDIDQGVPRGAADYIIDNRVPGPVWNWYELGGYLLWRFYPERRVFFDGRADVYSDGLFDSFITFTALGLQAQLREYRINALVINAFKVAWVHEFLQARGIYTTADRHVLVFFDDDAMVYLKDNSENRERIRRDGYGFIHPVLGWREPADGNVDALVDECRRAVASSSHNDTARRICEAVIKRYRLQPAPW